LFLGFFLIVLLLIIGGSKQYAWFLLAVGSIGMSHTGFLAGTKRSLEAHRIPITPIKKEEAVFNGYKQMGVLHKLEETVPGTGCMLRRELFNGLVKPGDHTK
jgi:hypothetical protein